MSTVTFAMNALLSAHRAAFGLAEQLRECGHQVIFATTPPFAAEVEARGFGLKLFTPQPPQDEKPPTGAAAFNRYVQRQTHRARMAMIAETETWLAKTRPDMVLLDWEITGFALPLLKLGIPFCYLSSALTYTRNSLIPSPRSSLIPATKPSPISRLRVSLSWTATAFYLIGQELKGLAYRYAIWGLRPPPGAALTMKQDGARFHRLEFGRRLRNVPTLMLSPRELDFPQVPRPDLFVHAGCALRREQAADDPVDARLYGELPEIDPQKPLIYASLGSILTVNDSLPGKLARLLIEVVRRKPHWQLVLQTGFGGKNATLGNLPANVVTRAALPQTQLLTRAAVAVTPGGFGTVREAACLGTPMLVVPMVNDQFGNAARVCFHGLGVRLKKQALNEARLEQALNRLIGQPEYRDRCRAFAEKLAQSPQDRAGCAFVDAQLLAGGASPA